MHDDEVEAKLESSKSFVHGASAPAGADVTESARPVDAAAGTGFAGAGAGAGGGAVGGVGFFGKIFTTEEFFTYCADGTVEGVKACLAQGKDPAMEEVEDGHTKTPLSIAILNGRMNAAKVLLAAIFEKGDEEGRRILNKPLNYSVDELPAKIDCFDFAILSFSSKTVAVGAHRGTTQYRTQYTSEVDRATSIQLSYLALLFFADMDKTSIPHNEAMVKLLLDAGADPNTALTPYRDGEVFDLDGMVLLPTVMHYIVVHKYSSTNIIIAMHEKGADMHRKATIAYSHDDDMHEYFRDVAGCCGPAGSFFSVCCWPICCCGGGKPTFEALNAAYIQKVLSTKHTPIEMLQFYAKNLEDDDELQKTLNTLKQLGVAVEPLVSGPPAPRAVSPMA